MALAMYWPSRARGRECTSTSAWKATSSQPRDCADSASACPASSSEVNRSKCFEKCWTAGFFVTSEWNFIAVSELESHLLDASSEEHPTVQSVECQAERMLASFRSLQLPILALRFTMTLPLTPPLDRPRARRQPCWPRWPNVSARNCPSRCRWRWPCLDFVARSARFQRCRPAINRHTQAVSTLRSLP